MKQFKVAKVILFTVLFMGMIGISRAQELGVRFGSNWGNYAAVDAIFNAGKFDRIHADVSFGGGLSVDALWDFVNKPLGAEAFKWYAGVGLSAFFGTGNKYDYTSNFHLGIPGEIGLEYHFKGAPLALGLDWRPVFVLVDNTAFNAGEFGLNFRYVFGKK